MSQSPPRLYNVMLHIHPLTCCTSPRNFVAGWNPDWLTLPQARLPIFICHVHVSQSEILKFISPINTIGYTRETNNNYYIILYHCNRHSGASFKSIYGGIEVEISMSPNFFRSFFGVLGRRYLSFHISYECETCTKMSTSKIWPRQYLNLGAQHGRHWG